MAVSGRSGYLSRPSPLPLRVSPGFAPGSLVAGTGDSNPGCRGKGWFSPYRVSEFKAWGRGVDKDAKSAGVPTGLSGAFDYQGPGLSSVLERWGWRAFDTGGHRRLGGDQLSDGTFTILRLWHTELHVRRFASAASFGPRWWILTPIEGSLEVRCGALSETLRPGSFLVADQASLLRIRGEAASVVASGPWNARSIAAIGEPAELPLLTTPAEWVTDLVVTLVNQTIRSWTEDAAEPPPAIWRAIEHAAALVAQSSLATEEHAASDLRARAKSVIGLRFSEPDLTVEQISAACFVSPASLYRAFKAVGTTPRNVLRAVRVAAAADLLEQLGPSAGAAELALTARECGFASVRALREAIAPVQGWIVQT